MLREKAPGCPFLLGGVPHTFPGFAVYPWDASGSGWQSNLVCTSGFVFSGTNDHPIPSSTLRLDNPIPSPIAVKTTTVTIMAMYLFPRSMLYVPLSFSSFEVQSRRAHQRPCRFIDNYCHMQSIFYHKGAV